MLAYLLRGSLGELLAPTVKTSQRRFLVRLPLSLGVVKQCVCVCGWLHREVGRQLARGSIRPTFGTTRTQDLIDAGDAEGAARAVEAAAAAASSRTGDDKPEPAAGRGEGESEGQGKGEQEEAGSSWEEGIELDAPDARGLRPIHVAARAGLTVRW